MAVEHHYLWDSCVFIAYLCDERDAYDIESIKLHLEDAKQGRTQIHVSTIAAAEVLPSRLRPPSSFNEFMDDFTGAVIFFDPSPNIMRLAGQLRDLPYAGQDGKRRSLSTPDAIMLATAVHLQEEWNVNLSAIHSFDKNGRKDVNGDKTVPILGYENFCLGFDSRQRATAERVIRIKRCAPLHPHPKLPNV